MRRSRLLSVCAVALPVLGLCCTSVLLAADGEPQSGRPTDRGRNAERAGGHGPQVVTIEVEILVSGSNGNDSTPQLADHFRLTTLQNSRAMTQLGRQTPVVVGQQVFGGRGTPVRTQTEQKSTGTVVQVEPQITGGGIVGELTIEKSWLEYPQAESRDVEARPQIDSPTTYSAQLKTTLLIEDGKAETISAKVSGGNDAREAVIHVSASTRNRGRRSADSSASRQPPGRDRSRSSFPGRGPEFENRGRDSFRPGPPGRSQDRSRFPQRPNADHDDRHAGSSSDHSDVKDRVTIIATRIFEKLDKNNDGELQGAERTSMGPMLHALGFDEADEVTIRSLTEKLRNRAGASGPPSRQPGPGQRGRDRSDHGNRPPEDGPDEPHTDESNTDDSDSGDEDGEAEESDTTDDADSP